MSINVLNSNGKVTAGHLKKTAYLYIRQSTLRQVFENTESTQRQYALRQRAVVLGWPAERIEIIDCDQGQSGASTADIFRRVLICLLYKTNSLWQNCHRHKESN
jgi:hypothetical protein